MKISLDNYQAEYFSVDTVPDPDQAVNYPAEFLYSPSTWSSQKQFDPQEGSTNHAS